MKALGSPTNGGNHKHVGSCGPETFLEYESYESVNHLIDAESSKLQIALEWVACKPEVSLYNPKSKFIPSCPAVHKYKTILTTVVLSHPTNRQSFKKTSRSTTPHSIKTGMPVRLC